MLPIATLPALGLLVRLGQADMLGVDGLARKLSWMRPVAGVFADGFDPAETKTKFTQIGPWNQGVTICVSPLRRPSTTAFWAESSSASSAALLRQRYYRVKLSD